MYTYKCYFHPKTDSERPCTGCKLPMCAACDEDGFCPECAERRAVVRNLKEFRHQMAANAHLATTTTQRLRLVRRMMISESTQAPRRSTHVGPRSPSRPLPELALGQLATRPLRDPSGRSSVARPEDGAIARQIRDQVVPAPVVAQPPRILEAPPEPLPPRPQAEPSVRRPAKPKARKAKPAPKPPAWYEAWWVSFAAGLSVGLVLLLTVLLLLHHPHRAARPVVQETQVGLDAHDQALLHSLLNPKRVAPLPGEDTANTDSSAPVPRAYAAPRAAAQPSVGDGSGPAVHWGYPRSGDTLGGLQYLEARLDAPARFSSLVLLVDGRPSTSITAVTDDSAVPIDTRRLSNGRHTLQLRGYAWQRAIAVSPVLRVTIHN